MLRMLTTAMLVGGLAACASKTPAPVSEREVASRPAVPIKPVEPIEPAPTGKPTTGARDQDWRPETYTVKRGDTLYSIALDHGLDYKELVALNQLENPNRILVGQVLRLRQPGEGSNGVVTAPLRPDGAPVEPPTPTTERRPEVRANSDTYKNQPKAVKLPYSESALAQLQGTKPGSTVAEGKPLPGAAIISTAVAAPAPRLDGKPETKPEVKLPPVASIAPTPTPVPAPEPAPKPATPDDDERIDWGWPAAGKVTTGFNDGSSQNKGIDIAGKPGQPVVASAGGKVIFSSSGLRGYGKLIIIKHNNTYLSAYAHNKELLVKEGDLVKKGQKIAEMGNSDTDQVKLHFEIRRLGKPVDPSKYLPSERS